MARLLQAVHQAFRYPLQGRSTVFFTGLAAAFLFGIGALLCGAQQQKPAENEAAPSRSGGTAAEMTLAQFRSLVQAHLSNPPSSGKSKTREQPPAPDLRAADELFLRLLMVQARDAAAHQSADRLAGWIKTIETRLQTQNAPQLDADIMHFAGARIAAESARIEEEKKRLMAEANGLMGRPPATQLTAAAGPTNQDSLSPLGKQHKELLAQAEDVIGKMYKNYQFAGISVTSLLEYERQLYETEVAYRQQIARDAMMVSEGVLD